MILRTIAILFFALGVVMGLTLGWSYELGTVAFRVNAGALNSLQAGVQRYLAPVIWDGVFVPLLAMPAWGFPMLIGAGFMVASALRPGRG